MASNFLNRQRVGGGGGGSLTPGSVTTTILANGAVTLPKIGAGTGTAGQVLARSTGNNSIEWITPGLTDDSVKAVHIDAGTATNDYVLTADSTETSGLEWKINAPAARTVNPSKIADITVVSGSAGKLLGISSSNHAEFALIDPFTVSDIGSGEITSTMLAANSVTLAKLSITGTPTDGQVIKYDADNTRLEWADDASGGGGGGTPANNSVGIAQLDIDGTAAVGQIAKVYDDSGTLKLQWSNDNTGSGGGATLPINLAGGSNVVTGDLPVADGGTGASTAAGARANLGITQSGGTEDPGELPYITNAAATPDDHFGRYDSSTTDRPDTGSTGGVIWEVEDNQVALETEGTNTGAIWIRTKTETNDSSWSTPANATLTQLTTIDQWRAMGFDVVRESTLSAAHPQGTTVDVLVTKVRGGFAGTGYFLAVIDGSTTPAFWFAEVPGGNTWNAGDLDWNNWNNAPPPDAVSDAIYTDYRKIPAGRVGLVTSLQISSTVARDSLITHGFASNASTFTAYNYSGGNLQSSTIGRTVAAGTWAKFATDTIADGAVDADAIDNALVIKESDGTAVSRMKVPQLEDIVLTGYTYTTNTTPAAGQVNYNAASRAFRGRARAGDEVLLAELIQTDFEFSITKTSSGQAASVRGVFNTISPVVQGVFQGQYRSDDITEVGDFTAGDTITLRGHKAVYNKLDTIPPIGLGLGHGSSAANHLIKFNSSGSAFTAGDLAPENLPTLLSDIQAINERLTLRQRTEPRTFGTTYSHSTSYSGVNTAGRFRWDSSTRELAINPLDGDNPDLVEYLSVPGIDVELTSSNGAVIHSTVEAVLANNSAITDPDAITVRLKNLAHHYTGDIRSGTVTVQTHGSFIGRGDTAVVQRDALDAGSGSAGQVLSRTATGLAWVNNAGGGGGTPADNSITHAMLMDGIIENDNMADDSIGTDEIIDGSLRAAAFPTAIDDIREISRHLTIEQMLRSRTFGSSYSRVTTGAALATAGTFRYVESSRTLSITPLSADSELASYFLPGVRFRLVSTTNFNSIQGRIETITANPAGAATSTVTATLAADADIVRGAIGTSNIQIATQGAFVSLGDNQVGINQINAGGTQAAGASLIVNSTNDGFVFGQPPSSAVKHRMMYRQEVSGVGELSGIDGQRRPMGNYPANAYNSPNNAARTNGTQTGEWTMANRSSDWISFNSGGLAYFGHIPAQPICLDVRVWVRWKSGSESYQDWRLSNSRVDEINLGSDGLMVVKLFAGGAPTYANFTVTDDGGTARSLTSVTNTNNAHVDCAYGTGIKTLKLSELPTAITDGTDFQLTLAYMKQDPSPNYNVRRSWFTADIVDGNAISANY